MLVSQRLKKFAAASFLLTSLINVNNIRPVLCESVSENIVDYKIDETEETTENAATVTGPDDGTKLYRTPTSNLDDETQEDQGCRVYLAESSIPGSGLGLYSGVDVAEQGTVTDMDIPIQVTDMSSHIGHDFDFLLDNYYWGSTSTSAQFEAHNVKSAMPSFGMAGNAHMGLWNVEWLYTADDIPRLHRNKDPGAGAVTDYPTVFWYATKPIPKGSEIMLNYGKDYFLTREEIYGMVPLPENYDEADDMVGKFHDIVRDENLKQDTKQRLWNLIRETAKPKTRLALPKDSSVLHQVVEKGTARHSLPDTIRSIEWLEEHGQCMDNLNVKPSTIPGAGRGAFASRFIPKGSLVAPAPLIQIPNRDHLNMYKLVLRSPYGTPKRKDDTVVGKQLLLNYCFGHPDSSLLLFPYSTAVQFINHKSEGYNAEIKWSNSSYHHADWLNIPVEEMTVERSGLMFDIVATRDISPEEEVFMDYGKEWEEAWNKHVEEWKPIPNADDFIAPEDMNQDGESPVRTIEEQEIDPYPSNLQTACYYYRDPSKLEFQEDEDMVIVETPWYYEGEFEPKFLRPCEILDRYEIEDSGFLYAARMFNHGENDGEDFIPEYEDHIVFDVPHHVIWFVEKSYTSDMFLKNAFRHEIGVPDGFYPSVWMNRSE